jgi:hypothetical protein
VEAVTPLLLVLVGACTLGVVEDGDCARIPEGRARDDCHYALARTHADDAARLDGVLSGVADPAARDMVLLRLAVDLPARAPELCARITTPAARDKCDKVVGRPHLGGVRP